MRPVDRSKKKYAKYSGPGMDDEEEVEEQREFNRYQRS